MKSFYILLTISSFFFLAKSVEAITNHEFDTIAVVLGAEGCSEGKKGLRAIASTIQNRSKSRNKTFYEVVIQPKQYSSYSNPNAYKVYKTCKKMADAVAQELVSGRLTDSTKGATHFENIEAFGKPYWANNKTVKIGHHTFYKEK